MLKLFNSIRFKHKICHPTRNTYSFYAHLTKKFSTDFKEGEFLKKYERKRNKKALIMKVRNLRILLMILQGALTAIAAISISRMAHAFKDLKYWKLPFWGSISFFGMFASIIIMRNKMHVIREIKLIKPKYGRYRLNIQTPMPFIQYSYYLDDLHIEEIKDKNVFPRFNRDLFMVVRVNENTLLIPKKVMRVKHALLYSAFISNNIKEIKEFLVKL